jgi:hypothetical protein
MMTRAAYLSWFIDSHNGHKLPLFLKKESMRVYIHYSLHGFPPKGKEIYSDYCC